MMITNPIIRKVRQGLVVGTLLIAAVAFNVSCGKKDDGGGQVQVILDQQQMNMHGKNPSGRQCAAV